MTDKPMLTPCEQWEVATRIAWMRDVYRLIDAETADAMMAELRERTPLADVEEPS